MTAELIEAHKNKLNDFTVRGTRPAAVTVSELVLCTDGSFTEATDGAYSRVNLTADCAASAAGVINDSFPVDVGADIVTHWQIRHDDTPVAQGPLSTSHTGAFTLPLRELSRGSDQL